MQPTAAGSPTELRSHVFPRGECDLAEERMTRRQFVHDAAVSAAALAASLSLPHVVKVGNAEQADTARILSYNSDMEYRQCGKTG